MAKATRLKPLRRALNSQRGRHGGRRTRLWIEQLEARNMLATLFTPQFGAEHATYVSGNGTPLSRPIVEFVFWGSYWTTPTGQQQSNQILNAAQAMNSGGFFSDEHREYGTDGTIEGPFPPFPNPDNPSAPISPNNPVDPPQGFAQSQLNQIFQNLVDSGNLFTSGNGNVGASVYVVLTPPGIFSTSGPSVGGYNTATSYNVTGVDIVSENYIWIGGGTSSTFNIDTYTKTISHELAESIVNPGTFDLFSGVNRVGWEVTPGAFFPNPPPNSGQIADYEAQNHTVRLNGVDVQSYWSQANGKFIVPDNNTQNFYVNNGVLTLPGNQNGILDNSFSLEKDSAGDLEADMNGESVVFDPGEIGSVTVAGGYGNDTLHIGAGILGNIQVTFTTHAGAQPFLVNASQLTIQGDQLGLAHNDSISMGQYGAGGVQATEDGDTIQFDAGEINNIQVNLGSGTNTIQVNGDLPAIVPNIVFANSGAAGNDSLKIDNQTLVPNATYSIGALPSGLGNPLNVNYTGWLSPLICLSNFTGVTLDLADGSTSNDLDTVNIKSLPGASTTLGVELGLGDNTVNFDSLAHNFSTINGRVEISTETGGHDTFSLNDQGDTSARTITLKDAASPAGWGVVQGLDPAGIFYQYSPTATLTLYSDTAYGNDINVLETDIPTSLVVDAVTYVTLGDSTVGARAINGAVSMESNESGTPDAGNIYVTINDLADATPRMATVTTFYPDRRLASGFTLPDSAWGSLSGVAPVTISYEYADTNRVVIDGNAADQIVNPGTTPVTLNGAPVVTSISPASGPQGGAETITVRGYNLGDVNGVRFGNGPFEALLTAPFYHSVQNDWTFTAKVPSSTTYGTVDVTVRTSLGGVSATTPADEFTYVAAPVVTSVAPGTGPLAGGNTVIILGDFLGAVLALDFGTNNPGTIDSDVQIAPNSPFWVLTATAPSGTLGTVDVTVSTPGGTSAKSGSDKYTYAAGPAITSVNPSRSGLAGGVSVNIFGSGFTGATEVDFGATKLTNFTIVSSNEITVTSPAGAAGAVDIRVVTPNGTSPVVTADQYTYVAPPTVTSVSPNLGPYEGGTTVTINGTNLANVAGAQVYFGAAVGTILSDNGTQIVATSPYHVAGMVDVTVATAGGTSADVTGDKFTFEYVTPIVSSVSPSTGPTAGGTVVTITGQYFLSAQQVFFGNNNPAVSFQVVSDTEIKATSPMGASGVRVDVTVVSAGLQSATSAADGFTYAAGLPNVAGVSPSSGPVGGGTTVTITGSNLLGATTVKFGGVAGSIVAGTDTGGQLQAITPAGVAGTVDVTVVAASGASSPSTTDKFTYFVPVMGPVVTGLTPASSAINVQTQVTIFGSRLSNPTAVKFGNVAAQILSSTDNQIVVASPALATPGPVDVTVTTAAGTSATVAADQFTYYGVQPTILALFGPSGNNIIPANFTAFPLEVVIEGANLAGATEVDFAGTPVTTFIRDTATEIDLDIPEEGPGTVPVTVKTPSGISNTVSFLSTAAPIVEQVFPNDGPLTGGTSVTIRGINIGTATAVYFGATKVTSFTFTPYDQSEPEDGQITVNSPPGAAGVVDVTVVSPAGTSADVPPDEFTYLPIPTITSISPADGPLAGGNLVAIDGTGFSGNQVTVDFGGVIANGFSSAAGNTSYVYVPAGVALGAVNVSVTTDGGSTPSSVQYTYDPAPVVSGLSRTFGAIRGGTPVTISGVGLVGISAIDFGDAPADLSTLTYNPDGTISVESPFSPYYGSTGGTGTVDVTVTTYDGTSAANPPNDQFTYTHAPYVTGLDTTLGLVAGGTPVMISGDDLSGVTAVYFGSTPATSFAYDDNSQTITAVAPAGAAGTVDVTVTTPIGTSDIVPTDRFTYGEFPSITGISPTSGSTNGGDQVTITGAGLADATEVTFGDIGDGTIVSDTDNLLVVRSPHGISPGAVRVTVYTPLGISANTNADVFTYVAPPAITSLDVISGSVFGNTRVTITGTGLAGATEVDFGAVAASIQSNTDNGGTDTLVVITSEAAGDLPGAVNVVVKTPYGVSADETAFTYVLPPTITALSTTSGPAAGGTMVTISGANLLGASAVNFGGIAAASFSVNADGTISTVSPAGAVATVDITVVTPGGASATSSADQFTYLPAPSILGVSPAAGPEAGGTLVTITGTGLADVTEVDFGGIATAGFTLNADGTITAASPGQSLVGAVHVTVVSPEGTSAPSPVDQFTYQAQPTITSLSANWGNSAGGDIVTITGSNLDGATAVDFGLNAGAIIYDSPGLIQAVSPAGAAGRVDVTVIGPGGTSPTTSADRFLYVGAPLAMDDSYTVTPNATLTVAATGVLSNDTDPQGYPLTAELLANPLHGALSFNGDGSFTYTPDNGYIGADGFVYQADNGTFTSAPTLVSLAIGTLTVTTTADTGPGSLRQAILDANSSSGTPHVILLQLPAGPQTINLLTPLPAATDPLSLSLDATQNVTVALLSASAWNDNNALTVTGAGTLTLSGGIEGPGNLKVDAGSSLTANHIVQSALVIGGTAGSPSMVTIDASDSSGNPLITAAAASSSSSSVSTLSNSVASNAGTEATLAELPAAIRARRLAQQIAPTPVSTAAGVSPTIFAHAMVRVDANAKSAALSTVVSDSLGVPVGESFFFRFRWPIRASLHHPSPARRFPPLFKARRSRARYSMRMPLQRRSVRTIGNGSVRIQSTDLLLDRRFGGTPLGEMICWKRSPRNAANEYWIEDRSGQETASLLPHLDLRNCLTSAAWARRGPPNRSSFATSVEPTELPGQFSRKLSRVSLGPLVHGCCECSIDRKWQRSRTPGRGDPPP